MRSRGLGIDFGTSATKAAVEVDGRMHLVIDDAEAHLSSAVIVPRKGALQVAASADAAGVDARRTITSVKRLLGRRYDDPRVRELDAGVAYEIVRGAGDAAHIRVEQTEIAPVQIVATTLRRVRELAERLVGARLDEAFLSLPVLTCPGYGPALVRAAQMAGFQAVQLVHEPVAALWGTRAAAGKIGRRILISDFGAGTYDCALVEIRPDRVEVLACGGDDYLGGDDLDLAMAEAVSGDVLREEGAMLPRDVVSWARLVRACERAKRRLTKSPSTYLTIEHAYVRDGVASDLSRELQRTAMEERWRPFVARAVAAARTTLVAARVPADLVDDMILVGGTSLVPIVRSSFIKRLARQPTAMEASDVAIATGLATMASRFRLRAAS